MYVYVPVLYLDMDMDMIVGHTTWVCVLVKNLYSSNVGLDVTKYEKLGEFV